MWTVGLTVDGNKAAFLNSTIKVNVKKQRRFRPSFTLNNNCVYIDRTDSSGQVYNHQLQIRYRALDLLSEWIDGYYQFDFKTNPSLIKQLLAFVKDEVRFHFVLRCLLSYVPFVFDIPTLQHIIDTSFP